MTEVPADLVALLPDGTEEVVKNWWSSLSDSERGRIAHLWDERLEVSFFSPQAETGCSHDDWEQVPHVIGGRFAPTDDDGQGEWMPGYFEHLLQHPELLLLYEPAARTFHYGCTRHTAAQACLREGAVPVGFVCPLADASCPLEKLRGAKFARKNLREQKIASPSTQ